MTMRNQTVSLPSAYQPAPECGVCGDECEPDGDGWICAPCGLVFDRMLVSELLDPDAPTCGYKCGFHGGTCLLSAGHERTHYTDCRGVA